MYKLIKTINNEYYLMDGNTQYSLVEESGFYQQFIQDVAEQGIEIVEGPDIIEPDYAALRQQEYPTIQEQEDMKYWDEINGTTVWRDTITAIKDKYPKTITGGTTIGEVPDWVQEAADNWTFNKQLNEYVTAVERLSQYILLEGREEVTEEVVIGQEPVLDEEGLPTFDDEGNQIMSDVTETVITQTAIEPLEEFVEVTTTDPETLEETTESVRNPLVVKDEEERAAAQAVVDATPQAVIDAINA